MVRKKCRGSTPPPDPLDAYRRPSTNGVHTRLPVLRQKFIRSIPLAWQRRAAILPRRALLVGLALWYGSGLKRSRVVQFRPSLVKIFRLSRSSQSRGLDDLERVGLVSIERQAGRSPVVTLLDAPETEEES
jgi:hypothetical protein